MNIGILVNSNIRFYYQSVPRVIDTLRLAGFDDQSIHIVCGGVPPGGKKLESCDAKVTTHFVEYDSIDFTALIHASTLDSPYSHFFYMHDTSYVGLQFKENLSALAKPGYEVITLRKWPSMNIGLYDVEYLKSRKGELEKIKNFNLDEISLQEVKKWNVDNEDYLSHKTGKKLASFFELNPENLFHNPDVLGEVDYYSNGIPRRIEYPFLDFYKLKSNWERKNKYEINL